MASLYNERQEEISNIVLEAHDKAIKAVKEGIKACEVDKVARDIISEYGYGDNFIHTTGHSRSKISFDTLTVVRPVATSRS